MSCQHPLTAVHHTSHLCTPADQQVHSSSMVLRAVVVLPLLLMVLCVASADDHVLRCIVMAVSLPCTMGSITNRYKEKQALSLIDSSTSTTRARCGLPQEVHFCLVKVVPTGNRAKRRRTAYNS